MSRAEEQRDIQWQPQIPRGHTEYSWGRRQRASAGVAAAAPTPQAAVHAAKPRKGSAAVTHSQNHQEEKKGGPLLPIKGKRNILVTSALPYVNNVPHLGNLIGSLLSADVYSRFCRLRGHNVIYICGTDEYGTATETKAMQEKVTPKELCDRYYAIHTEIYKWFNIEFDHWGRTTTPKQTQIAQDIFNKCDAQGCLVSKEVQQLFCLTCNRFLADRYVRGICPHCQAPDATGDQCDKCGKLLDPTELIEPKCDICKNVPELRTSRHLFLDLKKLQPELEDWVSTSSVKGRWSANSIKTTETWLKKGLEPRCITRDLKWGTPVPKEGYTDKVFYVWFDAPIGYLSITANYTPEWEKWWKNPQDVQLVQFMGKDNIPFHTVVFPSSLLGTKDPYTLLHHISTTEYLNYEDQKFSKRNGTGVFGDDAMHSGLPPEVWRYYLISNRPETQDSIFKWDDLRLKINTELLANLGNFVNRCLSLVVSRFDGVVPAPGGPLLENDNKFIEEVNKELADYIKDLEDVHLKDGLKDAMGISRLANKYTQENEPWELVKKDLPRAATVLAINVNMVHLLATILLPYIPSLCWKIADQLNLHIGENGALADGKTRFSLDRVPAGHKLAAVAPLVKEIAAQQAEEFRKRFGGQEAREADGPEFPLDLRVGEITQVADHPDPEAKTLFVLTINTGEEKERTVVSGVKEHYTAAELLHRKVVVGVNLKNASIRKVESQGLLVTAQDKRGHTGVLTVPAGAAVGAKIAPRGCRVVAKKQFDYKKDLKKIEKMLVVGADSKPAYDGRPFLVGGEPVGTEKVEPGAAIR